MAPKVTSSSNRSKRNSNKPVTTSKGRQNRANVSQAKVTNSGGRGSGSGRVTNASQRTNTGSARVTSSTRPSLPPGRRGGEMTTRSSTPARTGAPIQQVRVRDMGPTQQAQVSGRGPRAAMNAGKAPASAAKPSAASGGRPALPAGRTGGGMARRAGGRMTQALIGMEAGRMLGNAIAKPYKDAVRTERATRAGESGQSGRYVPGNRQSAIRSAAPSRPATQNRPSNTTPSTQTRSGSTPKQSGGGGASRSMPAAVTRSMPSTPAKPGQKWEDFNPNRGSSKSNNPLLDREGGYLRNRMKDREASNQADTAKKVDNKFGQDSGYEPKTKVDGSQYADKKPDMKNVKEYDRRKRRYYD